MPSQEKSIDFYEQKLIFQNLKKIRRSDCITGNQSERKVIGVTFMIDQKTKTTYTWKVQIKNTSSTETKLLEVFSNCGKEQERYEISLTGLNPKNATMLEMFAYCSYADFCLRGAQSAFGSFEELKKYLSMAGTQRLCINRRSYEELTTKKRNWEVIVKRMRQEYLDAGLYAQYQSCLYLQDVFDFLYEKNDNKEWDICAEEPAFLEDKQQIEDKTAEAVIHSMQKEWEKYCIDSYINT